MRVALDINGLYTTQAGVARYLRGLRRGLAAVRPDDVEIQPLAWEVENFEYRQPQRALKTLYREYIWARWQAPRRLAAGQAEVFHATAGLFVAPPRGVRDVITLHDLAWWRFPERFRPWQRWSGRRNERRILGADRLICISRFTADEAMRLLRVPASRLEVVPNGCDFHPDEAVPVEQAPVEPLPGEFFLFVGSLEPIKNLVLLRLVYERAAAEGRSLPPLVIIGARWPGVSGEGAPPASWIYLGRQPDEVLVHVYRRAVALIFPSKYEGFGLPVAEAMALGCPVICSPVASLTEVGGEAVHFAAQDPGSYLEAMRRLLQEPAWRRELMQRGLGQARLFSWRRCAEQTLQVYRDVMRGG